MLRPKPSNSWGRATRQWRGIAALALISVLLLIAAAACIRDEDLTLEQRQHQLERDLMCPVCDGQTLDQSQAQISRDMKGVIGEKLEAGETNQQIKDYFVARYGEEVLAAPTTGGLNLLVWVMPGVIGVGGALIVVFVLRGMRRPPAPVGRPPRDRGLDEYLAKVDRDLGLGSDGSAQSTTEQRGG